MKKKYALTIAAVIIVLVTTPLLTTASTSVNGELASCQPQNLIITCNGEPILPGHTFPIGFECHGIISINCCGDGPA